MCESLRGLTRIPPNASRLLNGPLLGAVFLGLTITSCGPAGYIYTVTNKASRKIAEAKAVKAEKHAPYEYWSAVTYLQMAREKAGEADYKIAIGYGRRAVNMSIRATRIAQRKPEANTPTGAEDSTRATPGVETP